MPRRDVPDHLLRLRSIKVDFLDGRSTVGTAEGNNAAWHCDCGALLCGRCYFQFGHTCHTKCGTCGKIYRVAPDLLKKAAKVRETDD